MQHLRVQVSGFGLMVWKLGFAVGMRAVMLRAASMTALMPTANCLEQPVRMQHLVLGRGFRLQGQ